MIVRSNFTPLLGLSNPHLQTLSAFLYRKSPPVPTQTQAWETADGDRLRVDLCGDNRNGTVLVFHGLEGCVLSGYAQSTLWHLTQQGFRVVFMHFRGCGGWVNRFPASYHAGHTADIRALVDHWASQTENRPLYAIGFSLGANALLKYLAEEGDNSRLNYAIAVSAPLVLERGAQRLSEGLSRIYQQYLVRLLKASVQRKLDAGVAMPSVETALPQIKTLRDFDHRVTAPLNGFVSAEAYYTRVSARQFLPAIRTPCHLLHAVDDPFFCPRVVPKARELPTQMRFELSRTGGHVGFVAKRAQGGVHWLAQHLVSILQQRVQATPMATHSPLRR